MKRQLTYAKKYGILLEDKHAKELFYTLLKLVCVKCDNETGYPSMSKLKQHLRQEHEAFFVNCALTMLNYSHLRERCTRDRSSQFTLGLVIKKELAKVT